MEEAKTKLENQLDQIAGAIMDKEQNPTINCGEEISLLEAQADHIKALIGLYEAFIKLTKTYNGYKYEE